LTFADWTNNKAKMDDWQFDRWTLRILPIFSGAILFGLEILSRIVPKLCQTGGSKLIPVKGKHLDKFEQQDWIFININKLLTIVFVYHLIWICRGSQIIQWKYSEATLLNTVGSLSAFYISYDFFYMTFHRILHLRSLYPLIHKHHHRQKAPSRGNLDAINVHPFEFLVGEYLHLVTVSIIPSHIFAVIAFVLLAGILASLNHTRYDLELPYIYSVKVHDVHHRLPESNYGQYTMFWDRLFGSYRAYNSVIIEEDK